MRAVKSVMSSCAVLPDTPEGGHKQAARLYSHDNFLFDGKPATSSPFTYEHSVIHLSVGANPSGRPKRWDTPRFPSRGFFVLQVLWHFRSHGGGRETGGDGNDVACEWKCHGEENAFSCRVCRLAGSAFELHICISSDRIAHDTSPSVCAFFW
jgi:hypothetical protein